MQHMICRISSLGIPLLPCSEMQNLSYTHAKMEKLMIFMEDGPLKKHAIP